MDSKSQKRFQGPRDLGPIETQRPLLETKNTLHHWRKWPQKPPQAD